MIGRLHHVELWVPDLGRAIAEWGWLLSRLGYEPFQDWQHGHSWRLGDTYIVVEQSPTMTDAEHDRHRPGLNHLAFSAGTRQDVDSLAADGPAQGWALLFADKHPYAGGPDHYAAYLASTDGYEVELVADDQPARLTHEPQALSCRASHAQLRALSPPRPMLSSTRGARGAPPGPAWRAARRV